MTRQATSWAAVVAIVLSAMLIPAPVDGQRGGQAIVPTLGLWQGFGERRQGDWQVDLVRASQTLASLRFGAADGFDFAPRDWLDRRSGDGFFHLGDLNLRLRTADGEWQEYSTASERRPVVPLAATAQVIASANLASTLPAEFPLDLRRDWAFEGDGVTLRFTLRNDTAEPIEIGSLGIPLVFNNILSGRSLDEAHAVASFHDPYIGNDAGYLQVTRLTGLGPTLVVVPDGDTPFEAYSPLLSDPTRRGVTFEGFYEWMAHSRAHAETDWVDAEPWNEPSSAVLQPGDERTYGLRFLAADGLRDIEATVRKAGLPVAVGVPGYVVPMDLEARLVLDAPSDVVAMRVQPEGSLQIVEAPATPDGRVAYTVRGRSWGRARLRIDYADGVEQTVHYRIVKPAREVATDLGRFLTTEQWYENEADPFGRSPAVISYDYDERRQVLEDNRAWIAGLGDEGGSGAWLAAMMKQLVVPDAEEIAKLERFVDGVLWGGLQYADGDRAFGVRKSMFYYEPDEFPVGTYSEEVEYGGWSSWDRDEAMSVVRSYDYPHVAAAYWVMYRLARNHVGLVRNHPWQWYLERAQETGLAMTRLAPQYAQFGQMDGTVFLLILEDLQREGWNEREQDLSQAMRERAEVWRSLSYPFGSEMPWDSTGQEEVYGWSKYFGFDDRAQVTLDAILGYMPTVAHWGYNGSARRYWDFQYAGKLRRVERQLHHYGSGLNAIPVLSAYRDRPDDLYLLRVGYGGLLGAIANITEDGFGPSGFHAYPTDLRIDGYSGDYGPGFFGHTVNTATYVTRDPGLGWLAFGGNLTETDDGVVVEPRDSARQRLYVATQKLWLTLDAGTIESAHITDRAIRIRLAPADPHTPAARLRLAEPASDRTPWSVVGPWGQERGALVVPLDAEGAEIELRRGGLRVVPGGSHTDTRS